MAAALPGEYDTTLLAQITMTLPAIFLIASAPLAGILAGLYGRRRVLIISLVGYVLGGAGVLLTTDLIQILTLRLILGVAGGALLTICLALIGEHYQDNARERILGYATALSSLSAGIALVTGGYLVDQFNWRAPFSLYLLAIPIIALAFVALPDSDDLRPPEPPKHGSRVETIFPVSHYYLLLVLLTLGMFTPAIQLPFLLEDRGTTSAETQGQIISATSFVAILSAGSYGWLRRWITVHGFLIIDAVSMGTGILIIALATSTLATVVGCVLVGIGAGMSEPAVASLIFDRMPVWVHGFAMGLIVSALNVGQFVNPLAFAAIGAVTSRPEAFLVVGAILTLVGSGITIVKRTQLKESGAVHTVS